MDATLAVADGGYLVASLGSGLRKACRMAAAVDAES